MSRSYQIRVSENVTKTVHVEDGIETAVDMLPILPQQRMNQLLGEELESRGFHQEEDGNVVSRTEADGVVVSVDLRTSTINIKLGQDSDVDETVDLEARVANPVGAEDKLRDQAMQKLDEQIEQRSRELRAEVTKQLENRLSDIQSEIDAAVNNATIAALTEKANQLGNIQDIAKDQAGNVTIRVKL